jgi:hypothetical protein
MVFVLFLTFLFLVLLENVEVDKESRVLASERSSVTSHMTKSHGDLSADDFSDSDYDLGDSGSDWFGSTSDILLHIFCTSLVISDTDHQI